MTTQTNNFMDASCRKCGAHIGWHGRVIDMPRCRKCGAEPDRKRLEADQAEIDNFRELLTELRQANPGWDKWQKARVSSGLSLRQAAKMLGVTPTELSDYEQCRKVPSEAFAQRMSDCYSGENVCQPLQDTESGT